MLSSQISAVSAWIYIHLIVYTRECGKERQKRKEGGKGRTYSTELTVPFFGTLTWDSFTLIWPLSRLPWKPSVTFHTRSPGRTRCTKLAGNSPTLSLLFPWQTHTNWGSDRSKWRAPCHWNWSTTYLIDQKVTVNQNKWKSKHADSSLELNLLLFFLLSFFNYYFYWGLDENTLRSTIKCLV